MTRSLCIFVLSLVTNVLTLIAPKRNFNVGPESENRNVSEWLGALALGSQRPGLDPCSVIGN